MGVQGAAAAPGGQLLIEAAGAGACAAYKCRVVLQWVACLWMEIAGDSRVGHPWLHIRGEQRTQQLLAPPAAEDAWLSRTVGLRQLSLDSCGDVGWLLPTAVFSELACQLDIAAAAKPLRWRRAPVARDAVATALPPLLQSARGACTPTNGISQRRPAKSGPRVAVSAVPLSLPPRLGPAVAIKDGKGCEDARRR